jgi:hypothetical protein
MQAATDQYQLGASRLEKRLFDHVACGAIGGFGDAPRGNRPGHSIAGGYAIEQACDDWQYVGR